MNEAIIDSDYDSQNENIDELSQILENVWNDSSLKRWIKNIKLGVEVGISIGGTVISHLTGEENGFLKTLGFAVGTRLLNKKIDNLSEKMVKFFSTPYQNNIYDFKKNYEKRIQRINR